MNLWPSSKKLRGRFYDGVNGLVIKMCQLISIDNQFFLLTGELWNL